MASDPEGAGPSLTEIGATLHTLLNQLDNELRHRVRLNHFEILLMRVLREQREGVPLREMPGALQCSHQRASSAVVRLEARGLVSSTAPGRPLRVKVVRLTVQGRRAIDAANQVYVDLLETLLEEHLPTSLRKIA